MTKRIGELKFIDLYIGVDYCDIKGLDGSTSIRTPAPPEFQDEIGDLKAKCERVYEQHNEPEFAIIHDDVMFRVTQLLDVQGNDVFILRKAESVVRPYASLGISQLASAFALHPATRGLILIVGEMASGKTTTAASYFKERLTMFGGIGVAIEDPPETKLDGVHGSGRCLQVPASRKNGGYKEQLIRAVRSGADAILLGEIREEETAFQAVQAGINGHLIYSTMHAGNLVQGLERFSTWCQQKTDSANALMSDAVSMIIHQKLERVPKQGGGGHVSRMKASFLILSGQMGQSARAKIREGNFHLVSHDIEEQSKRNIWMETRPARQPASPQQ